MRSKEMCLKLSKDAASFLLFSVKGYTSHFGNQTIITEKTKNNFLF
jgi:hypothetical protein